MLRFSSTATLVAGVLLVSAAALPERAPIPDPDLYVSAGCSGCHGSDAAGAFGPTLAGTGLSFETFLEQLRSPRGMMPPVATSLVSDEQARSLFDYVAGLEEPEGGPVSGTACRGRQHGHGHHGAGACRHGTCRCRGQATS